MPQLNLVLGLLAAVAALAALGRRAGLPGPIVFALGGLALALIPGLPRVALDPDLVLVVFLPPLVFAAAQGTTWAEVRALARPIALLAVGLVLVTMAAVAAVAHAVFPDMPWAAAFTLGAVVAPPDTVAAKAVAERLRLPRPLVAVLEGEGLFNDAVALVAFQIASAVAVSGAAFVPGAAALALLRAAVVAAVVGVALGWLGRHVLARVGDPPAEATVTLLLPFAAYLGAEHWHGSGVVAVLALALYLNRFRDDARLPFARGHTRALWDTLDFLLTGLSFVLVGLQLRSAVMGRPDRLPPGFVVAAAALVSLTVIVVRLGWVFGTAWAARPGRAPLDRRLLAVTGWAGMRGVVSLAVALSLPTTTAAGASFKHRSAIVFITFVVIFVTLVGQGLTLPVLIRRLGIAGGEGDAGHELPAGADRPIGADGAREPQPVAAAR